MKRITKLLFVGSLVSALIGFIIFQGDVAKNYTIGLSTLMGRTTNVTVHCCSRQPFAKSMRLFPWIPFQTAVRQNNVTAVRKYSNLLLTSILIPFITKEPLTPINASCKAPPLPKIPENCINLKNGTAAKKIGVIINFGFDVDALEVHLHELDSLVDKFFLVEGLKAHNRILDRKLSVWDLVKYTSRFSPFQNKILHFIVDDADYHEGSQLPAIWDRELLQGRLRVKKFVEWNNATGYFSADDWIGIGDTDEIPSRQAINMLKNCEMDGDESGAVNIGIWFPFPYDDTIFKTDWPVPFHPFTLGNPTYWKVSAITVGNNNTNGIGTGRKSGGKKYLLGGMHFSEFPYLPFQLTKRLAGTESEIERVMEIGLAYLNATGNGSEVEAAALKLWNRPKNIYYERVLTLEKFREKFGDQETNAIVKRPWFYQCNPGRFSGFRSKSELDKRLF